MLWPIQLQKYSRYAQLTNSNTYMVVNTSQEYFKFLSSANIYQRSLLGWHAVATDKDRCLSLFCFWEFLMRLEIKWSAERYSNDLITSHLSPQPDSKPFKCLIFHSEMFSSLCQIPYQSHSSSHLFALAH